MPLEILIQMFFVGFTYCFARHDVPPVDKFTDYGATKKEQDVFHRYGLAAKCFVIAITFVSAIPHAYLLALAGIVIMGGLFDPIISIFRKNKQAWYHLGTEAKLDRLQVKLFGTKAGKYKAVICLLLLITINLFIFLW